MITKMIINGRFTDSTLPPGTTSLDTIFISPPLSPAYPTQPPYSSASTLSTRFRRIHARSFIQIQTSSTISAPQETLDTKTRITLYTLFFIISCCALFSLAYFLNHVCKLHITKLQKRYNYESYGEFEGLITRRIYFRYRTFDAASPYNAEENGRLVSSAGSTENWEYSNPFNDTKATKAINAVNATKALNAINAIKAGKVAEANKAVKAIKAAKAIQTAKTTDGQLSEPEWESAQSSHLTTPNRRRIVWARLPRPIRRPPTSKQPAAGGIKFAASPPRPSRANRPTHLTPPKRLRSPPLPPDFLTISNATTAPMGIPGQEASSWTVGLPWVTTTDRAHIGDEGKKDRDRDPDDEEWGEIDRIIRNERDRYADDKKVLDAARRKDLERERESGFVQSREECSKFSTSSESFWAY
ncbi:hypothetical protein BHYA_0271g00090 [Botrytis hyacinthi]|uniref:Uncharacterized protein n=1 Tax=Botrytis hyacinthi TaxID=278943 RepID=A0A4Z1GDA5_9HELO|nr:hypothetical protein BHYA_0271g00090 [Botrytis hyacinthi]